MAFSDLTDAGAQEEAVRRLRRLGVDRALSRAGAREGDEVTVGAMTFTWGDEMIAVVKVGSSSVTPDTVDRLCGEIAAARADGHTVVVVTSGAIAAGLGRPASRRGRGEPAPGRPRGAPGRVRRRPAPAHAPVAGRARAARMRWRDRSCWRRSTSCTARSTSTPAARCATSSSSAWCRWSTRTTPWPTRRSASATTTGSPRWWRTSSARSCWCC